MLTRIRGSEKQVKWDHRFLGLAQHIAGWSKDPSTQVGAVIVDTYARIVGHGYNGFPRGVDDAPHRLEDRTCKLGMVVHAELNAILNSGAGIRMADLIDHTIYCTHFPCSHCAAAIIQSGIVRVVAYQPPAGMESRWADSWAMAKTMFNEAAVDFDLLPPMTGIG